MIEARARNAEDDSQSSSTIGMDELWNGKLRLQVSSRSRAMSQRHLIIGNPAVRRNSTKP